MDDTAETAAAETAAADGALILDDEAASAPLAAQGRSRWDTYGEGHRRRL